MGDHIKDLTEGVEEGTVWDGGGHRYQLEKVVGNGAFGIVWRGRDEGGTLVAIKKVILDRRYHNRELEMMKQLEHECVIKLLNFFEKPGRKRDETYLHLVMDFLPETIRSVALQYHKQRLRFPTDHVRVYLYQALRALEYVHSRRICHRDLKPDNFLVDPMRLTLKLIDFGCAKVLVKGQPNVSYICSRYYRAPELLFGATEYTCSVDLWSIGTILAELLLGHLPFQGQDSTQQHLIEIMKLLGTPSERELRVMRATCQAAELPKLKAYPWDRVFPSGTSHRAIDLAHRLLTFDPTNRLTAPQALTHPFFDGVQYILADGSAPAVPESCAVWQKQLSSFFEQYVAARNDAINARLPALEQALKATLEAKQSEGNEPVLEGVRAELGPLLAAADQSEAKAMRALSQQMRASVRSDSSAAADEAGDSSAAEVAQLREKLRLASDPEVAAKQQAVQQELATLRAQLAEATATLAQAQKVAASSRVEAATQTETADSFKSPAGAPGRRNSSNRNGIPSGPEHQASPMQSRPSVIDADAVLRRGPANLSGFTSDLGQMTPVGMTSREASGVNDVSSDGSGSRGTDSSRNSCCTAQSGSRPRSAKQPPA